MEYIEILKNQHQGILETIKKLSLLIGDKEKKLNLPEIYDLFSSLSNKLRLHLDMEDKILYPDLLNHSDKIQEELAQKYIEDMGSLSDIYKHYLNKWAEETEIHKDPEDFVYKTEQIIGLILDRIYNEEYILFPQLVGEIRSD